MPPRGHNDPDSVSSQIRDRLLAGETLHSNVGVEYGKDRKLLYSIVDPMRKRGYVFDEHVRGGGWRIKSKPGGLPVKRKPRAEQLGRMTPRARARRALLANGRLATAEVVRWGGTAATVHSLINDLRRHGTSIKTQHENGQTYYELDEPPAAPPVWVAEAEVELASNTDVDDLQRQVAFLRKRLAILDPPPPTAPPFGSTLRVTGLFLEQSGEVRLMLRNGRAAYTAVLVAASE
jgi:hypothetical protein